MPRLLTNWIYDNFVLARKYIFLFLQYLIFQFGWRGAFIIMAGIALQSLWLTALCREPPNSPRRSKNKQTSGCSVVARGLIDFSLLRDPIFVVTLLGLTCLSLTVNLAYQHSPSRGYYIGLTREEAASIPMSTSIGSLACRVPMGFVFMKKGINRTALLAGCMFVAGVVMVSTALVRTYWFYMIYGFILGAAIGKYWVLFEDLNARIRYLDKDK